MALIVETGTALADAESYVSVADATAYHAARGNAAWASLASDTVREQNLRKATDYMLEVYRLRWAGWRVTSTQALDWPRYEVPRTDAIGGTLSVEFYASDAVPSEVVKACCELALRASEGDLLGDLDQPVIREKVGPIEVEYGEGARQTKRYPAIDALLAPLFTMSGNSMKVSRA